MTTWREVIGPRIAQIIANARARGLDEKALRRALRNPYKGGWLAAVWSDERARQLGRASGRIAPRRGTRAAQRVALERSGVQLGIGDRS